MPLTLPPRPPAGDTTNWDVDLETIFQAIKTFVDADNLRHYPPQASGRYRQITRANGAGGTVLLSNGVEQAIGIMLPKMSIDRVSIEVATAGTAASTYRIGLRPIDADTGAIGAPVVDASFALDSTGPKTATVAVALAGGPYALTYVRQGDTGNTGAILCADLADQWLNGMLFNLGSGTGTPATGHSIGSAQLNTGVTGALPGSVAQADQNTNTETKIPAVALRRA